jgi:HEXXH motif-containing protein
MGDLGDDPQMHLGHPEQANCEALTQEALVALEGVWPEMASLTKSLITHFVWFTSPTQWSSTEPTTFGAVYANPRSFWTMPYFFETLLHEGGHLHLMVKQTIDPLLINPNERTSSPLRADPRPLKGVLHAVFVLARMAEGLHRLAVAGGPVSTESAKMARINVERLGRGLQSLEGVARFTPAGHELFGSLRKAHLDLARKTA